MNKRSHQERILALDVHRQSFGFAVLEGPDGLVDCGIKSFRCGRNSVRVPLPRKVESLLDEFSPKTIVIRIALGVEPNPIIQMISPLAKLRRIAIRTISHEGVVHTFPGHNRNKHEIAMCIASRFPELTDVVPPEPKPWKNEHYRTSLFEALAAGLAYFASADHSPSV